MGVGRPEAPSLERMQRLMSAMGDPQRRRPVIHITGTNGKGSTAQMATRLLMAQGLTVGTYTSPHLERINERIARNGEPIADEDFAEQIAAIADLEVLAGVRPSWFEIVTAAAFRWFADVAVDVMVLEVGPARPVGRHQRGRRPGRRGHQRRPRPHRVRRADAGRHRRREGGHREARLHARAGRDRPRRSPPSSGPRSPAITWERDLDFGAIENQLALGGRLLDLRTPYATYPEVFLPLHGAPPGRQRRRRPRRRRELLRVAARRRRSCAEAFAEVTVPGRFEVLGHQPLVIVDGAHNPAGADICASVMAEDFAPVGDAILVVGVPAGPRPGRDAGGAAGRRGRRGWCAARRRRRGASRPRRRRPPPGPWVATTCWR